MNTLKKLTLHSLVVSSLAVSTCVLAGDDWEGKSRDAWIDGKLEASYLLNTELNNFMIDTQVEDGMVTLEGEVPSEVHKMLAGEIAGNMNGVYGVDNNLVIREQARRVEKPRNARDFSTVVLDATTTASLKTRFALNEELDALDINVSTFDGVVTLEGKVDSETHKQLAQEIASEYDHVMKVDNQLSLAQ